MPGFLLMVSGISSLRVVPGADFCFDSIARIRSAIEDCSVSLSPRTIPKIESMFIVAFIFVPLQYIILQNIAKKIAFLAKRLFLDKKGYALI